MKPEDIGTLLAAVVFIAVLIAGFVGWCLNIYAIAAAEVFSGLLLVRCIGVIVAPLGAVLGYF